MSLTAHLYPVSINKLLNGQVVKVMLGFGNFENPMRSTNLGLDPQ